MIRNVILRVMAWWWNNHKYSVTGRWLAVDLRAEKKAARALWRVKPDLEWVAQKLSCPPSMVEEYVMAEGMADGNPAA